MSCTCQPPDNTGAWRLVGPCPASALITCGGGCGCQQWNDDANVVPWLVASAAGTALLILAANHKGRDRPRR